MACLVERLVQKAGVGQAQGSRSEDISWQYPLCSSWSHVCMYSPIIAPLKNLRSESENLLEIT